MNILFIGAHPDDVEVGCGGTIFQLGKESENQMEYICLSDCTDLERNQGIIQEWNEVVKRLTNSFPNQFGASLLKFPNRRLFENHMEIRKSLEEVRDRFKPDMVFCPSDQDINQDHGYTGQEVKRVFRESSILFYEVPRSTMNFVPNYYIRLDDDAFNDGMDLVSLYRTQKNIGYMRVSARESNYIHRGNEIGVKYAQAFQLLRYVK